MEVTCQEDIDESVFEGCWLWDDMFEGAVSKLKIKKIKMKKQANKKENNIKNKKYNEDEDEDEN